MPLISLLESIEHMEEIAPWLESPNPLLRQIADQTFDLLLVPTIKAQLHDLSERFPHLIAHSRVIQELVAMLILSGDWLVPDTREWIRELLRMNQPLMKGALMPNESTEY